MPYCHTKANNSLAWLLERTHVANSRECVTLIRVTVTETLVTRPEELTDLHPIIARLTFLKIEKQKTNDMWSTDETKDWSGHKVETLYDAVRISHSNFHTQHILQSEHPNQELQTLGFSNDIIRGKALWKQSLTSRLIVDTPLILHLFCTNL